MAEQTRRFQPFRRAWEATGLHELTFLKNRPRLRYRKEFAFPMAEPDADDPNYQQKLEQHEAQMKAYQQELHWQGFISPNFVPDVVEYPIISQDIKDLEEYLMPIFWDFNQKAKYYQNSYYLFQWVFIFGAFFTTVLAVMTTYYGSFGNNSVRFLFVFSPSGETLVTAFSIATAVVSFVTTYYTLLSNYGEPRKRWSSYRRLTEELRMLYFKFISRIEPFNQADRVDQLRREVLDIRRQEQENG